MNNNNHHNLNCSFAEEVVSYIYGEIGEREKTAFENHLVDCSLCTSEVAEFANVSFSIGAWRDSEFSHLPTPVIEIPYETPQTKIEKESVSGSWLSSLRQLFSLSPAWTTTSAAMAALVLCIGLVFVVVKFSDKPDLAVIDNKNTVKTVLSPTPENIITQTSENPVDIAPKPSKVDSSTDSIKSELADDSKNADKSPNNLITVSNAPKTKIIRQNSETVAPIRTNLPKRDKNDVKPVQSKKAPSLNTFEEEDDDSLRLADLFAEIDTDR